MITDAQKKYLKIIFQLGGDIELVSNKMWFCCKVKNIANH